MSEGWLQAWTWRPHRLFRVKDLLYLKDRLGGSKTHKAPEGYLDAFQAAARLNRRPCRVKDMALRGELEGYTVPYGMKSVSWYISERSIVQWLNSHGHGCETLPPADGILPALICARDETCLKARRELWVRKGRKWRRRFWRAA